MTDFFIKVARRVPVLRGIIARFKDQINSLEQKFNIRTDELSKIIQTIQMQAEKNHLFVKLLSQMLGDNSISFQGQDDQDILAYLYFMGKKSGFYVDIGANDGITINNTYFFEKLGWKGICVEPLPDIFAQLRQNRTCDCYNIAVAEKSDDDVDFIRATGVEMLSGLASQMKERHKKYILSLSGKTDHIKIKTLTFNDVMKNYPDINHIDFLSIDVEGAEMDVIQSIDFSKYTFGFITIENNEEVLGDADKLIQFMNNAGGGGGYKVLIRMGIDIIFIPK